MAYWSSARDSGSASAPPKASFSSVPPVFSSIFYFYLSLNIVVFLYLKPRFIYFSRNLDPISLSLLVINQTYFPWTDGWYWPHRDD
jgi:hypothetical protein